MFDVNKVRNDFPMIRNNPDLIYFDSAATSFKPDCVINEVVNFYSNKTSNIHRGDYDISFNVSKEYEETRNVISKLINNDNPKQIVFTSGATSSLNIVAYGYGLKNIKNGVILTTYSEHASSILPWYDVAKTNNIKVEFIPLNDDGTFNLEKYENCFNKYDVKLVELPYVSNVLGYKNPIKEICEIAHKYNALVSVDGAQAVPHIKVDVKDLDCDFLSFSSHKMLGPSGIGVLYGKYELLEKSSPINQGGGANARYDSEGNVILKDTPTKFEAGTPNIEGVLGMKKACEYLLNVGMENIEEYDHYLLSYAMDKLSKLDNVIIYNKNAYCSIISFNVKDVFAQDAGTYLNKNGIAVRTGNHCAKVLHNVINTNETIRASLYLYNTKEEIDKFVDVVKEITVENCIGAVI